MNEAATLRCPACGAPADPKAAACHYCKVPLHALRCPWCFSWSYSEKDCPRCGSQAAPADAEALSCPTCRREPLCSRDVGGARLSGCNVCGGVWADKASFKKLCDDRQTQAAYLGQGSVLSAPRSSDPTQSPILYRPCARCGDLMNRVNFAARSGVILDFCKPHGLWFDPEELRRIVEFIRGGGLDLARQRELEDLASERRRLEAAKRSSPDLSLPMPGNVAMARDLLRLIFELRG